MSAEIVDTESEVISIHCDKSYSGGTSRQTDSTYSDTYDRKLSEVKSRDLETYSSYDQGPSLREVEASQYNATNVNCYGFILGLSDKARFDDKIIDESDAIKKYTKFLNNWDLAAEKDKKLLRRTVLSGVPNCLRAQVWKKLLKIDEKIEKNPGVYKSLKRLSRVQSKDATQIDKDVERTYRNHIAFNVRYSIKQRELFNLLLAYSIYDKKIGYCQGMNEIAATLLLYLSEEETFWAMTVLTLDEFHNLHGFYCENFPKLVIFEDHLKTTMDALMPNLMAHFSSMDFDLKIVTTKWFLLCFINSLPFAMLLRVWDRFLLEGSLVLFPIAFTIFKCSEKLLLKMSIDQVADFFKSIGSSRFDIPRFFQKLEKYITKLHDSKFYPIPGVAHDAIDIDITQILAAEQEQGSLQDDSEFDKNHKSYSYSINYYLNATSLSSRENNFRPRDTQAPVPMMGWEDFFTANKHAFLKEIDENDLSEKIIEIEKIANIIASVSKG